MIEYYKIPRSDSENIKRCLALNWDMAYEDEDEYIYLVGKKRFNYFRRGKTFTLYKYKIFLKPIKK